MKYIAIGDIHGHYDKLYSLYNDIKNIDAQIVFLGDYIDRGDNSKEVIDLLIEIKKEKPNTIILKGNHEDFIIKSLIDNSCQITQTWAYKVWMNNGGLDTLASYDFQSTQLRKVLESIHDHIPQNHIEFYKGLENYYETEKLFFVHAGVDLNKPFHLNDESDFLWIRPPFGNSYSLNKMIIHGHTPDSCGIVVTDIRICVDTAAYRGGKLTGIMIDDYGKLLEIFEV